MATMIFTGAGRTGDWTDPKNWKGGVAPGAADTAQVVGGESMTVTSPVNVNNIMVIGGETITFTNAVTTHGVGNCKGLMVCVDSTIVFAPGSSLTDGGVLQVGVDEVGAMVVRGTTAMPTAITSNSGFIGKLDGGVGTVTIDDASWTTAKGIDVGIAGAGTLSVINQGQVTTGGGFVVGAKAGSTGSVSLAAGGSLTVGGVAAIGGGSASVPGGVGSVTVDAGSTFSASRGVAVSSGSVITLAGGSMTAGVTAGGLDVRAGGRVAGYGSETTRTGGWVVADGVIEAQGGTLAIGGPVWGVGTLQIDAGSTMAITGSTVSTAKIGFADGTGTLALAAGAKVSSVIDGFTAGDAITMAGITKASWNAATDVLTLSGASNKASDSLHLGGSYAGDSFLVTQAGGVGVITVQTHA